MLCGASEDSDVVEAAIGSAELDNGTGERERKVRSRAESHIIAEATSDCNLSASRKTFYAPVDNALSPNDELQ